MPLHHFSAPHGPPSRGGSHRRMSSMAREGWRLGGFEVGAAGRSTNGGGREGGGSARSEDGGGGEGGGPAR
uniref:Uncharacterized protein n=1 Tax=Arundo donax TaxID=35708 RepID=A0A0A9CG82_ARUDO